MALLQLPPEVLQDILALTRPEGFENVLMSCRAVLIAGEPLIDHHNRLKRRYSNVSYSRRDQATQEPATWQHLDKGHIYSPMHLLHEIGQEPLIAEYITDADFANRSYEEVDIRDNELNREVRVSQSVLGLLRRSPFMRHSGLTVDQWYQHILTDDERVWSGGDDDLATILLLTLLPNVKSLSLPRDWDEHCGDRRQDNEPTNVLDAIVEQNRCVKGETAPPLGRLRELRPSVPTGYDDQTRLQPLTPFLALPSLKIVQHSSGTAMPWGTSERDFNAEYEKLGASIETMELVGCVMGALECSEFFRAMASLKTLRFHYETKWHGLGHDWEAGDFMASLMAALGDTLESLSLTIMSCYGSISPILTMQGFQRLTDLELDIRLFMGPPYEEFIGGRNPADNVPADVPKLINVLPKCLARFMLLTTTAKEYQRCLGELFTDFAAKMTHMLPGLVQTTILRGEHVSAIKEPGAKRPAIPATVRKAIETSQTRLVDVDGVARSETVKSFTERFPVAAEIG